MEMGQRAEILPFATGGSAEPATAVLRGAKAAIAMVMRPDLPKSTSLAPVS